MTDRTGQTWAENDVIFLVVGPPVRGEMYDRHPVCVLHGSEGAMEERFMDEGEIQWEELPYMRRVG